MACDASPWATESTARREGHANEVAASFPPSHTAVHRRGRHPFVAKSCSIATSDRSPGCPSGNLKRARQSKRLQMARGLGWQLGQKPRTTSWWQLRGVGCPSARRGMLRGHGKHASGCLGLALAAFECFWIENGGCERLEQSTCPRVLTLRLTAADALATLAPRRLMQPYGKVRAYDERMMALRGPRDTNSTTQTASAPVAHARS